MDAGDDLSDPVTLITDPAKSVNNPTMTAGMVIGQYSVGHFGVCPGQRANAGRRTIHHVAPADA